MLSVKIVEIQTLCRHERKKMSDMNWFGWCTWDAFYTDVVAEGVRNGLESLEKGGIISEFVIIDDGWQVSKLKLITQPKSFTRQSRRDTKGIDKGIETSLPWRSSSSLESICPRSSRVCKLE
ncbi:hypothetical protein Vadar_021734 [Vaccinium darrowii]|uniref:Uncharacterized protein n=1 Tax=Vaccinium darrowii TaxID=229202 RepID=A0ACB7ZDC1_9ERIC|nr:hypothetical protein Vadar_021734 [Vaccinium darrowii]